MNLCGEVCCCRRLNRLSLPYRQCGQPLDESVTLAALWEPNVRLALLIVESSHDRQIRQSSAWAQRKNWGALRHHYVLLLLARKEIPLVWVFTLREKWSSMFGVAALAGLAVLMAACGSQSPASTPGMTVVATFTAEAATPKATTVPAATEAPAAVPTVAASAPAETSTVEAGATGTVSESGRVAAPTFNPAVNKIAFKPI